jgi:hypothetical protein
MRICEKILLSFLILKAYTIGGIQISVCLQQKITKDRAKQISNLRFTPKN